MIFNTSLKHLGSCYYLIQEAFYWILVSPFKKRGVKIKETINQIEKVGANSLLIVGLVSLFFGLTLAMLTAYQLRKLGSEILVGSLVGVSFMRELGPLLTALVVAGRVGASFAAEIGSMLVSEEIDALESMGIQPVSHLVSPRLIALGLTLPCLTLYSDVLGILGGLIIAVFSLSLDVHYFFNNLFSSLVIKDLWTGLLKSFSFAVIIVGIGCYQGLTVRGGAEGVGIATTKAVVLSMILIIIVDCFWNAWFYF